MYTVYFIFEWKYAFSIAFDYCMFMWLSNQERRKKKKGNLWEKNSSQIPWYQAVRLLCVSLLTI